MTDIELEDAVATYLRRKAAGDDDGCAGTYASNAESILGRWVTWLEAEHGLTSPFDLEVDHLRSYAETLSDRVDRGEYTASTARTYFAVVRAFLSWCVGGGILDANPAATDAAERMLPADGETERQFWTAGQRRALEEHVCERALAAAEGDRDERRGRLRDYAMVAVLAHAGVRAGELFRVSEDDRRTGATWADVDFYSGTIRVLGTSRRFEEVRLPAAARTPLRRYRVVLDPPSTDWPVFPTRHAPSIARRVRTVLAERGVDGDEIEELLDDATATRLARERTIAPPSITTEGARSILRRLCADADVAVDGDYLKPGGARRALGERPRRPAATSPGTALGESVREQSIVLAEDDPTTEADE